MDNLRWMINIQLRDLQITFCEQLKGLYEMSECVEIFYLCAEWIYKRDKFLIKMENSKIKDADLMVFESMLKRLLQGEPIQYVIGEWPFMECVFNVRKGVLIPRPETEELVALIIEREQTDELIRVIDIGTGSGCIAIALEKKLRNALVIGVDVSDEALEIAKGNADRNKSKVTFEQMNILTDSYNCATKYDIIVSNPPYILKDEIATMHKNVVDYEPHLALFVTNDDALEFYKAIIMFAKECLQMGGRIYFETHYMYNVDVFALLITNNYRVERIKDIAGHNRMIMATKC